MSDSKKGEAIATLILGALAFAYFTGRLDGVIEGYKRQGTPPNPAAETEFLGVLADYAARYEGAPNTIIKDRLPAERLAALCRVVGEGEARGWIGQVEAVDLTTSGYGTLRVSLNRHVGLHTRQIEFLGVDDTLMPPGSPMTSLLPKLKVGSYVRIDGRFQADARGCVTFGQLTEGGRMTDPTMFFRFTRIEALDTGAIANAAARENRGAAEPAPAPPMPTPPQAAPVKPAQPEAAPVSSPEESLRRLGTALTLSRNCGATDRTGAERVAAAVDPAIKALPPARQAAAQDAWVAGLRSPEARLNGNKAAACARLMPEVAAALRELAEGRGTVALAEGAPAASFPVQARGKVTRERVQRYGRTAALAELCGVTQAGAGSRVDADFDKAAGELPAVQRDSAQRAYAAGKAEGRTQHAADPQAACASVPQATLDMVAGFALGQAWITLGGGMEE